MDAIYEVHGLTKRYGRTAALNGVDFAVTPGKLVGLLGPNGSGKTTLMKISAGLLQPTAGSVIIDKVPVGVFTKAVTSYLPDHMALPTEFTADDAVSLYADFFTDFDKVKANAMLAEQRPYRAADDLSSNVLPNGHGQSQHQVPALAQQAVKLLNFNKKADGEHNKKAYGRCQCQQGHGDPGQRQPVGGVLDRMAQNIGKNVQHKHARRNGQNNTACGFELIM